MAPRAAICASEAPPRSFVAHCAVWNISRDAAVIPARPSGARRYTALTRPQNCQLNCSASLFFFPVRAWPVSSAPRRVRPAIAAVLRRQNCAARAQSRCAK